MKITKMDYAATGAFSQTITDYLSQNEKLKPFFNRFPSIDAFEPQLKEKEFSPEQRQVLHKALLEQYSSIADINPKVQQNLDLLLQPNTYTITTGHQLNIFTGPLYFVYKIITAVNTCRQLQEKNTRTITLCRSTGWPPKTTTLQRLIILICSGKVTNGRRSKEVL